MLFAALSNPPPVEVRARTSKTAHPSDLQSSGRITAIGVALPWRRYAFEFEGVKDPNLGHSLLGTVRWTDASDRYGYVLTVPMASTSRVSPAVILQVMLRFDLE